MIYTWFTGKKTIIIWPLRKIVTLSLRPLRPYRNQLYIYANILHFMTADCEKAAEGKFAG